ncbi:MAG: hypothetical protein E7627_01925 [Ruminococcaceae bacterium]|nr:hypothetical protein [Oscillospiraceae bacterium]
MSKELLIEVHCTKEWDDNGSNERPAYCKESVCYDCMFNKCPYATFTSHENALCYIGKDALAENIISFGGEMLPDGMDEEKALCLWKQISEKKINEAYREYFNEISK